MLRCMITNMLRKYHSVFILCINHRVNQKKKFKFDMSNATHPCSTELIRL